MDLSGRYQSRFRRPAAGEGGDEGGARQLHRDQGVSTGAVRTLDEKPIWEQQPLGARARQLLGGAGHALVSRPVPLGGRARGCV